MIVLSVVSNIILSVLAQEMEPTCTHFMVDFSDLNAKLKQTADHIQVLTSFLFNS